MRALGLDIGRKKTGVAITDHDIGLVKPLKQIFIDLSTSPEEWFQALLDILDHGDYKPTEIDTVVLGSWKDSDHKNTEMKKLVRIAQDLIKKKTDWEVVLVRETYTSIESREILKGMGIKKKRMFHSLDSYAATLLLIDYLELIKPTLDRKMYKNK